MISDSQDGPFHPGIMRYGAAERSQQRPLRNGMVWPYYAAMVEPVHTRNIAQIAAEAIAAAGGGAAIARSLGIGRASVQQWKSSGIPAARAPAVARLTGIPLHELRPDLFPQTMINAPEREGVAA